MKLRLPKLLPGKLETRIIVELPLFLAIASKLRESKRPDKFTELKILLQRIPPLLDK